MWYWGRYASLNVVITKNTKNTKNPIYSIFVALVSFVSFVPFVLTINYYVRIPEHG